MTTPDIECTHASDGSRLTAPRCALGSCVRVFITRDTRGQTLAPAERYNHFPAAPLCAISWRLSGEAFICDVTAAGAATRSGPVPQTAFIGPSDRPALTWNPAGVHMFAVVLLPDAWHALTGLPLADCINGRVPVSALLSGDWLAMCDAVRQAPDDAQRIQIVEEFLLPRWRQVQAEGIVPVRQTHDWLVGLATRAAVSGWGRSVRQAERRIRRWVGLSMGELRRFSRVESLFFSACHANGDVPLCWAEEADKLGFSDQAHMCREARRISGHSPAALHRGLARDETLWLYRAWLNQSGEAVTGHRTRRSSSLEP